MACDFKVNRRGGSRIAPDATGDAAGEHAQPTCRAVAAPLLGEAWHLVRVAASSETKIGMSQRSVPDRGRRGTRTGCLVRLAGVAVTFAAIATTIAAGFLGGTAVAGAGFGRAFQYRTSSRQTRKEEA